MPGGAYSALSGMQTRLDELDRIAGDLANVGTAGYKMERKATVVAERAQFTDALQSAVDVVSGVPKTDFRRGTVSTTGRDLDVAIDGKGFFVVDTPNGPRYTRNGAMTRRSDGVLTTTEGEAVLGTDGPINLGTGAVGIDDNGEVTSGNAVVGRLRIVNFDTESDLARESGARFRAIPGAAPTPMPDARILRGSLEQSNAAVVDLMVKLTEVTRSFESLQRAVSTFNNELDARAITELAKR